LCIHLFWHPFDPYTACKESIIYVYKHIGITYNNDMNQLIVIFSVSDETKKRIPMCFADVTNLRKLETKLFDWLTS